MKMKTFRRKQLVELVETLANGNVLLQNAGEPDLMRWEVPLQVFRANYEEVTYEPTL